MKTERFGERSAIGIMLLVVFTCMVVSAHAGEIQKDIVISGLSWRCGGAYLKEGDSFYMDRNYVLTSIPEKLKNSFWLLTSCSDKRSQKTGIYFETSKTVDLYVALCTETPPNWVGEQGFKPTHERIKTKLKGSDIGIYHLYRRECPKGQVVLGPNQGRGVMYIVLLRAKDDTQRFALQDAEVMVDNEGAGFVKTGQWNVSTRDSGYERKNYLWHRKGTGEAKAVFTPNLPQAGPYEVYVKWVASKPDDRATNAPFTIKHAKGQKTLRIDLSQVKKAGKWRSLGIWAFEAGAKGSVVLSNDADNSVVADAVKFLLVRNNVMDKIVPQGRVIYEDKFENLNNWHAEGLVKGVTLVKPNMMRLDCTGSRQGGAGCMAFCRIDFPDNICIEYDLFVEEKNGLVITFLGMKGVNGEDAITGVPKRTGVFRDYTRGSTRSYHVSISRYGDKGVHTGVSNWRRNPGLHMMRKGADLCEEVRKTHHVAIIKKGPLLQLQVNGVVASGFIDPQRLSGEIPTSGKVGFRLIGSKAIARFSNFKITALD